MSKFKGLLFFFVLAVVGTGFALSAAPGPGSRAMPNGEGVTVNRANLNFGMIAGHDNPDNQSFSVNISGVANLEWNITDDMDWLICHPTTGTSCGTVTASVLGCQLSPGQYTGRITVSDDYDPATPQTIDVTVNVYTPGYSSPPFGSFDTPVDGSTVRSSVPVTGWVLDDVGVDNVKIYRCESGNLTYIGDAVLVEGARPDVEQSYPQCPMNYQAGWGYMMLTNFLPGGGSGTYNIHAAATDKEGNEVSLGTKTIFGDNGHAVKPFGAIDDPAQGGTASGSAYINWGWALTPQPKHIPTDGSTINVYVDGVNIGHPHYNNYRKDIAELFPDFVNSDGAVGYFYFDTTSYADGVHTIQWTASDSEGSTDGIGSRYFTISNSGGDERAGTQALDDKTGTRPRGHFYIPRTNDIPLEDTEAIGITTGFRENNSPRRVEAAGKGIFKIAVKELERMEIDLSDRMEVIGGYMTAGEQRNPLPIGSTLDMKKGKFYWQPGPGFTGEYRFEFIFGEKGRKTMMMKKKGIIVTIGPKFE